MTWDATDWTITRSTKEIEYIGDLHGGTAPTYVTGIELHRALMDFADAGSDSGDDQLARIASSVAALPRRQKEAITCRFLQGLNVRQTAMVMNCAEGTVKAAVYSALESLRTKFIREDKNERRTR